MTTARRRKELYVSWWTKAVKQNNGAAFATMYLWCKVFCEKVYHIYIVDWWCMCSECISLKVYTHTADERCAFSGAHRQSCVVESRRASKEGTHNDSRGVNSVMRWSVEAFCEVIFLSVWVVSMNLAKKDWAWEFNLFCKKKKLLKAFYT